MSNLRCKIYNTKNKGSIYFHHICKESKLMIWRNNAKTKQYRQRHNTHTPTRSMLQLSWSSARIFFCQASKVNRPDLPFTYCLTIFMAWVSIMLQITPVHFILGQKFRKISVWKHFFLRPLWDHLQELIFEIIQ